MTIKGFRIKGSGIPSLIDSAESLDEWTRGLPQGFYTTFITNSGGTKVLGLKSHLDRLYVPAVRTGIRPSIDRENLCTFIARIVVDNLPYESRVRLILGRVSGEVFIGIQPFHALNDSVYSNGVHVHTTEMARQDPRLKETTFIAESAAQRKLLNSEVFEILMTRNGGILEGLTSNFYAIKGRLLITARRGVLLGVTRMAVLRLARGQGMSIASRSPRLNEPFDEAFLTSSSRGIVPIVSIDDHPVGEGRVGAWTKRLSKAYQFYVEERSERLADAE